MMIERVKRRIGFGKKGHGEIKRSRGIWKVRDRHREIESVR